ncbi:MAG: glycosyltransferase family 2 protein [Candidatus Thiothrix singaporensis]|uniref:Glycosyltransferase family 2 protein n=1 Tax=Candidatus Thiothrix singaporensis TaxID=2799669 RepID=A0A7L6ASP0_9GAMM|nr:MAG: glycosyltransferase family 2 protein [Candidatus Thiothrix singaporensis]
MFRHTFTVFTPTYNRAETLHRVYDSLCAQTFRDFEWLVVDDGSTDNTRERVEDWQAQAAFPIRYLYQQNAHKKVAHNLGINAAQGELFLTLDSDDACKPQALERLLFHWRAIPDSQRNGFSAVTVLCEKESGEIVGSLFPAKPDGGWIDSDSVEMSYRYKVRGEKWGFQRTDVLRQFPFEHADVTGLIPENVVWERISERYKTRFVNEALRIYHDGEDQVTRARPDQHALGHAIACKSMLEHGARYFLYAPLRLLDVAMSFVRFKHHAQQRQPDVTLSAEGLLPRLLVLGMTPFGYARFCLDRRRLVGKGNQAG